MLNEAGVIAAEFVLVAVACALLLRYYMGQMVTPDVAISVYLSWVLGFGAILILPYDLSQALITGEQSPQLVKLWTAIYWSTFFLAWVVLPIQMEFHGSGHFTVKDKLKDAFMKLLLALVLTILAVVFYICYNVFAVGGSVSDVMSFLMAMGNTYGVLLITLLMGTGLVAIPKRLWLLGDVEGELNRLYLSASGVEEAYQNARYELEDCEWEIGKLVAAVEKAGPKSAMASAMGANIEMLRLKMTNFNFAGRSNTRTHGGGANSSSSEDFSTPKGLVSLHAKLITAQLKARASERRWRILIESCRQNQITLSGGAGAEDARWCAMPTEGGDGSEGDCCAKCCASSCAESNARCNACCLTLNQVWLARFYGPSCRVAAVVCGAASCLILWSELVMASSLHSPIGLIMSGYNQETQSGTMIQAVAFIFLSYMTLCTYWPLFRLNIGWSYRLQGPQQSPPSSLIFNGEYLSRLQFSLGYNFLLAINIKRTHQTSFNGLIDNLAVIPIFGTSFTIYAPVIMVIVALITLFNGFNRLLSLLGIESEETGGAGLCCGRRGENSPEVEERIKGGQAIVAGELKRATAARQQLVNNISISKSRAAAAAVKSKYVTLETSSMADEESQHGSNRHSDGDEEEQEEEEDDSKYSFTSSISKYKPTMDFDEETGAIRPKQGGAGGSRAVSKQPSAGSSSSTGSSIKNPLVTTSRPAAAAAVGSSHSAAAVGSSHSAAAVGSSHSAAAGKSLFGGKTVLEMTSKSKSLTVTAPAPKPKPTTTTTTAASTVKKPAKDVFSFDDDDEEELQKYRGRYD